jgi:sugar-specific transcriptional regulator TrmB
MIIQKILLNKLRDFGLNTYESRLWTALLSRGISTAGELSEIANVPRSRTYDVLESLEKKGFIVMKIGKPIKYIAVPPEEVIERVKKRLKEQAEERSKIVEEIRSSNLFDELNLLHNQGVDLIDPNELSGFFKERSALYNQLDTMIKKSKQSIVITTSEEGILRKEKKLFKSLVKAKERGIKIKIVVPITKKTKNTIKNLSKIAEIRNSNTNARFVIIDKKEMIFTIMDDKNSNQSYDSAIWVNSPFFATTMYHLFENYWKTLIPYSQVKI